MEKKISPRSQSRMSDAAVHTRTGKTWSEWFKILDAAGAQKMNHKEIVAVLGKYGISGWWQQMVTVAYEQERGLRDKHEKPDGYQISISRTIAAPASKIFAAWEDPKLRRRWLRDSGFLIRKTVPGKTLRITWIDKKSSVEVYLLEKDRHKTQTTAQHSKLPTARAGQEMKVYWTEMLEKLKALMEK